MSKQKAQNKTEFFQALEQELLSSENSGFGLNKQLDEAATDLADYFEDSSVLMKALNTGSLTFEHAFLKRKAKDTYITNIVNTLLCEFRDARNSDPERFFEIFANQMEKNSRAINNAASVAILQGNKDALDSPLLVKSWFRDIGDLLEGSLQPLIRFRLQLLDFLERRASSAPTVGSMSFGSVVGELVSQAKNGSYYCPPPYDVPISQWRNIANHNSYDVTDEKIICTYGPSDRLKTISLTLDELTDVLIYCNDLYYAHKVAIEIFGIDNIEGLIKHSPNVRVSDYTKMTNFAYGLVSEGFSIIEAKYVPGKWILVLKDIHSRQKRATKTALQKACSSYMIFENPIEISAIVHSKLKRHRIGFVASLEEKDTVLPPGFKGDIWRTDDSFRMHHRIEKKMSNNPGQRAIVSNIR